MREQAAAEGGRYDVEVRYDVRIPVRDGLELSANLWLPSPSSPDERFPAVLEYIPYRKDDWRANVDHGRMSYFAERGFAGCRVDIRGTGSSPGVARDEYTPDETHDGYDAVEWLAAQPWCNGNVGMWGISYGGFTAIQVAMLRPPHLKAIVPVYATDDRYTDDVHYLGGCLTGSELAQYAVSMVGMNALPPRLDYAGGDWAALWRERLEATPPWLIEWLRQQTDGPYWRQGSLAPDYERLTCPMLLIGGWADGYTSAMLRMLERCTRAPRRGIIGPWVHSMPEDAYPAPNVDSLHEMVRFFDHWLRGAANGVMDEPVLTLFRQEYTPPEAFPPRVNGAWHAEAAYPIERREHRAWTLGEGTLEEAAGDRQQAIEHRTQEPGGERPGDHAQGGVSAGSRSLAPLLAADLLPHRPTIGTRAGLCYGAGGAPNGLARDLRPDEALSLVYTAPPLDGPLDVIGFPEALLFLSASAPVATVVVRLTDVAPDGTSALVSTGVLNLTHRESHSAPAPLVPGAVYRVPVQLKATGYRFLAGHRVRLTIATAAWPVIWPSPYRYELSLHRGEATPSRLILPVVPPGGAPPAPALKATPPDVAAVGGGREETPMWQIVEDVIDQAVTVRIFGGDTTLLPDGRSLFSSERIELTAYHHDPARTRLYNEVVYTLTEHGYTTDVRATGSIRSTERDLHVDVQLTVLLNGSTFFQKAWLESVPRQLV